MKYETDPQYPIKRCDLVEVDIKGGYKWKGKGKDKYLIFIKKETRTFHCKVGGAYSVNESLEYLESIIRDEVKKILNEVQTGQYVETLL